MCLSPLHQTLLPRHVLSLVLLIFLSLTILEHKHAVGNTISLRDVLLHQTVGSLISVVLKVALGTIQLSNIIFGGQQSQPKVNLNSLQEWQFTTQTTLPQLCNQQHRNELCNNVSMSDVTICTEKDCINVSSVCQNDVLHVLPVQTDVLHVLPVEDELCQTHEKSFARSVLDVDSILVEPVTDVHPDISRYSWRGGQSVPVTAAMTTNLASWQYYLKDDENKDFILDGVEHGFRLINEDVMPNQFFTRNYKSATSLSRIGAEKQIITEIQLGRYVVTQQKPSCVSSLGAIPKTGDKVRLIHDMSRPKGGINAYATNTSVVYTTIDFATTLMTPGCFLAKIDLESA